MVPAFFHPYKGNWFPDEDPTISELTPEFDRSAPFTGVGWTVLDLDETGLLHEDARLDVLPERGRALCRRLLGCRPRLCLGGGGRWARASVSSTDSEHQLAALLADSDVDWTAWIVNTAPSEPQTALWDQARAAANRGDAVRLRETLAEAHRRYGPAGRRMLDSGVLNVLALRVAERQSSR
jgi:hypothetical protein